jgi:outer membrane protein OmpA-like peptidoglycan-associated protein
MVLRAALAGVSLLAMGTFMAACSDVPDAVNPVSWWNGVFGDDEDQASPPAKKTQSQAQAAKPKETPGADQPYPAIQDVPDKPAAGTTVEDRKQVMQGLAADKTNAQYSDEAARASDTGANPSTSGAPAQAPATAAAPAAGAAPPTPAAPAAGAAPPPPAPAAQTPPAPPPASTPGRKSYMAGEETAPPPQGAAPPAGPPPAPANAVTPPAPGSSELNRVYEAKLKESAPTVTTAVAGPTGTVPGASTAKGAVAEPPDGEEAVPASRKAKGAKPASKSKAAAPEQMAAFEPAPLEAAPMPVRGLSSQVGTVYFGDGSADILDGEQQKFDNIVAFYKEHGGKIHVVGYASSRTGDMDPVRHQMANFAVSAKRADTVARELIKRGVKSTDINTTALSDAEPIYYEVMPAGEAGNRRVEIFIDY